MTSRKETKRQITFWLEKQDAEMLGEAAQKAGLSVASFIRLLIKQWTDGIRFEPKK